MIAVCNDSFTYTVYWSNNTPTQPSFIGIWNITYTMYDLCWIQCLQAVSTNQETNLVSSFCPISFDIDLRSFHSLILVCVAISSLSTVISLLAYHLGSVNKFPHHSFQSPVCLLLSMNSKFINQVIMNKETLTATAQHCISCYHIFTITCFTFIGTMHIITTLDRVFSVMLEHFKLLLKSAKLFFRLPPPSTVWFPSVLDFLLVVYPEELDDSRGSWNRSIPEYMFLHCDLQSLVSSIHSKIFPLPET